MLGRAIGTNGTREQPERDPESSGLGSHGWGLMGTALDIQGNDKEKQLKNYLPVLQDGIRIHGFLN